MATRSMPTVSWMFMAWATTSLVPTPSVDEASTGLRYFARSRRNSPANPPMSPITSGRSVRCTLVLSSSTACSPAWIDTPASAYVTVRRRPVRPLPADQSCFSGSGTGVAVVPERSAPALFMRSDTCVTFSPYASRLPPQSIAAPVRRPVAFTDAATRPIHPGSQRTACRSPFVRRARSPSCCKEPCERRRDGAWEITRSMSELATASRSRT